MRKYALKYTQTTYKFDTKAILHNCILYYGQLSYVGIFPVYLWYWQIFQQEVGLNHVHYWKSENIRGIPKSTGFISVLNALVICVCFKIYFLIDHHCKIQSEWSDMLKNSPNLPNFLQWVNECRAHSLHQDDCNTDLYGEVSLLLSLMLLLTLVRGHIHEFTCADIARKFILLLQPQDRNVT